MRESVSPLYFAVAGLGVGLVFSAVRNDSPLALLRSVLTGGAVERRRITEPFGGAAGVPINALGGAAVGGLIGPAAPGPVTLPFSPMNPASPATPTLVSIGQGSHKLTVEAAAAFARWQRLHGTQVYVTDSYRPFNEQLQAHLREPARFADPRASPAMHTRGLAVDVDLGRTTGSESRLGQPRYDRLYQTAYMAGFFNYERGLKGDTWHFSFGVAA